MCMCVYVCMHYIYIYIYIYAHVCVYYIHILFFLGYFNSSFFPNIFEYGINDIVVAIPEELPINQSINQSICHTFIISL